MIHFFYIIMYHGGRLMNLTAATLTIGTVMTLFFNGAIGSTFS
jgi:hypothetical protein